MEYIITEKQILEINKSAFRNAGAKIAHILNNLQQLNKEKDNEIKE